MKIDCIQLDCVLKNILRINNIKNVSINVQCMEFPNLKALNNLRLVDKPLKSIHPTFAKCNARSIFKRSTADLNSTLIYSLNEIGFPDHFYAKEFRSPVIVKEWDLIIHQIRFNHSLRWKEFTCKFQDWPVCQRVYP